MLTVDGEHELFFTSLETCSLTCPMYQGMHVCWSFDAAMAAVRSDNVAGFRRGRFDQPRAWALVVRLTDGYWL